MSRIAFALVLTIAGTLAAAIQSAAPAQAERLITTLSNDRIFIKSNFAGERLAVFGVVEDAPSANTSYDVVVTVRGPRGAVTVRRKLKWGPLWLNLDARKYIAIPAFIAVLSNRNIELIASAEVLDDLRIGINSLIPPQTAARGANDPDFRDALERLRSEQGLFFNEPEAVKFISPTVFQASIAMPGTVPLGAYDVDVSVFQGGALYARKSLGFSVSKSGVEQVVTRSAHEFPLSYGIVVVLMALSMGWVASIIFRRD